MNKALSSRVLQTYVQLVIVPTQYAIDQHDIDISKNSMFKTHKWEYFGSLAPLARNNLREFLKFLVFWSRTYHEYYKQKDIICTDKICNWPTRYWDLKES